MSLRWSAVTAAPPAPGKGAKTKKRRSLIREVRMRWATSLSWVGQPPLVTGDGYLARTVPTGE